MQSKCALSTAECGIFIIISSYFFILLLSISLALSRSLCLSVLELMAEFKMLIQSLNIRVSSLSPPPCQHLLLIHCSDEQLIYIITAAQASFHSHKCTHTSMCITSTCLTVPYCVWPCRPETAAWSAISTHTTTWQRAATLPHTPPSFCYTSLAVISALPSSTALFVQNNLPLHYDTGAALFVSLSFRLVCCFGKIAHLCYHKNCLISPIKHTKKYIKYAVTLFTRSGLTAEWIPNEHKNITLKKHSINQLQNLIKPVISYFLCT